MMEMEFLLWLQSMRTPFLDQAFPVITSLADGGFIWVATGIVLLIPKRTRKQGILLLFSLLLCLIVGNIFLKNLVARDRPCWINDTVTLLIENPADYSFPSGHTMHSFAAATSLWFISRRWGIAAFALAALIAFTRMYLFVHYPTDILAGAVLGTGIACVVFRLFGRWFDRLRVFE